jgi:hypothetical protein
MFVSLLITVLCAYFIIKNYGLKSWQALLFLFVIIIFLINNNTDNSDNQSSENSEELTLKSDDVPYTQDGVYILNGNSRAATITVMGDSWFFQSSNQYSAPESGTIRNGKLSNSELYPRGDIYGDRINFLGYTFIKE